MKRREFMIALGSTVVWPLAARAGASYHPRSGLRQRAHEIPSCNTLSMNRPGKNRKSASRTILIGTTPRPPGNR